jgi:hypothetical protein
MGGWEERPLPRCRAPLRGQRGAEDVGRDDGRMGGTASPALPRAPFPAGRGTEDAEAVTGEWGVGKLSLAAPSRGLRAGYASLSLRGEGLRTLRG